MHLCVLVVSSSVDSGHAATAVVVTDSARGSVKMMHSSPIYYLPSCLTPALCLCFTQNRTRQSQSRGSWPGRSVCQPGLWYRQSSGQRTVPQLPSTRYPTIPAHNRFLSCILMFYMPFHPSQITPFVSLSLCLGQVSLFCLPVKQRKSEQMQLQMSCEGEEYNLHKLSTASLSPAQIAFNACKWF